MPHKIRSIQLGGGAHIDGMLAKRSLATEKRILWFPTFRDTPAEAEQLARMCETVLGDLQLQEWLECTQRTLVLCHHINAKRPANALPLHPRIECIGPSQLDQELGRAELFISDYSGLLIDWLALPRPVVFFPFDLEEYLRTRRLYVNYEEWHYGPLVRSAAELIVLLIGEDWQNLQPWQERRQQFARQVFPFDEARYAETSYQSILSNL